MKFTAAALKILASHLIRLAIIYVRQSTVRQVVEHTASAILQRSLADLARHYGWPDDLIVVIDQDQGRSGTSTAKREGFKWLRQQIFEERVGAIICWDASRIARDSAALAQLIKLCAATNTLIIDGKGVYDPNNENDRIFLGLINVLVDAEGRRIGDRAKATKRARAEAGELPLRPATGYVRNDKGHLILDPRKKVQKAIRLFFSMFERLRSATKVVKHFNRNKIKFPTLRRSRGKKSEIVWGELTIDRALDILRNLMYAGTYAFGLTKTIYEMPSADATEQKKKIVKVSLDSDEPIIMHGAHEGYITLEKYNENQKILEDNRYGYGARFRGAVRDGSALLQGLVFCGMCLGKLSTHYDGRDGAGGYFCGNKVKHLGKYVCLSITARRLDKIVIDAFFEAVSPAQLQLTLQELDEVDQESRVDDCREQDELESAKVECNKAQLRFERINPRNTLVFKKYEKELQEKMAKVEQLEKKRAKELKISKRVLTNEVLQSLLALPQDLRTFWECSTVTNAERKQLLRCLISKVTIKRRENSKYQDVFIQWMSGAITPLTTVKDGRFLHPEAVELMRRLAPDHTITQIIDRLHEAGFTPTRGYKRFSRNSVLLACKAYGIKLACPELPPGDDKPRGDGRYPAPALAKMFNVSLPTIYRWCEWGLLDGVRKNTPKSAYWIKITPEQILALKNRPSKRVNKSDIKRYLTT